MKRLITLTVAIIIGCLQSFSQNGIYGGDFEHWKQNPTYLHYQPDSSWFWSLNQLDTVSHIRPMVTVFPCDTAHSGNYSAKMVTQYLSLLDIIIPGVIGTLDIDWTYNRAILGIPYPYGDSLPIAFSGYYQSYPVESDSSAAVILLSKWNSVSRKRDTLAYNYLPFYGIVNTWTRFETDITYRDNTQTPDSLTILLLSCGGFNAKNMFGSQGRVGSMALFDDVSLTGVNGVRLMTSEKLSVKLSPNPVSEILKVELEKEVSEGTMEIYNSQGQQVKIVPVNGMVQYLNVKELPDGIYFFTLKEGNRLLSSGKFIVNK